MSVTINASTSSGLVQTADTSGTVEIQSNGTTKLTVASTGVSGTVINGTAVASTSGTSIDFTSIPSWVKKITVMFAGVSTNGTSIPLVQLGAGSVTTSGYVSSSARLQDSTSVSVANSTAGFIIPLASASNIFSGAIQFTNITGNTWVGQGVLCTAVAGPFSMPIAGLIALGGTLDRVRITTTGGTDTFDAGSINIQYEG
jgi:hypothetical protein